MAQGDNPKSQSREEATNESGTPLLFDIGREPTLSDLISMDDEDAEFEPARLGLRPRIIDD